MTTLQPRPSRLMVIVRPAWSVWEDTALAWPRPPPLEDEALDDDETLTAERLDARAEARELAKPRPLWAEAWPLMPGGIAAATSRASGRMRVTTQSPPRPAGFIADAGKARTVLTSTSVIGRSFAIGTFFHGQAGACLSSRPRRTLDQQRRLLRAVALEVP